MYKKYEIKLYIAYLAGIYYTISVGFFGKVGEVPRIIIIFRIFKRSVII